MNDAAVKARIKALLTREAMLNLQPEGIRDDAKLITELGLDSIQALELIMALEKEFGIVLDDEDLSLELLESVNSMTAYVLAKCGTRTGQG